MNSFSQIHSGDSEFKKSFSGNKAICILSLTSPNLLKRNFLEKLKPEVFFFLSWIKTSFEIWKRLEVAEYMKEGRILSSGYRLTASFSSFVFQWMEHSPK